MQTLSPRTIRTVRPALAYEVLSNVVRRAILDSLRLNGACSVRALVEDFDLSELRLHNHLNLLEEAELIRLRKGNDTTIVHFSPVGWARLKKRWQSGMENTVGLRSVG
ncbi:MAG: helix-turn-helix domain-containing protein [Saprospiraceae bacterium]